MKSGRLAPCRLRVAAQAMLVAGSLLGFLSAKASPFPSSDQNPLLGGFSFTAPARLDAAKQTSAELTFNWSSTAAIQEFGADTLVVDAESREWRFAVEHAVTNRLTIRADIPFRTTSGGSLDSTIEQWHDVFGLPNGDRSKLPRDRLRIDYQRGNRVLLDYHDVSLSGIGDVALSLGWQLRSSERSATSVWSTITLPTGDAAKLTGVDAVAGSVAVAHTLALGSRTDAFGHVGLYISGAGEPLADQRESSRWLAMAGAEYRATPNLGIVLQVDAHGASFDSEETDLMGEAFILSFGADYTFPSKWRVRFAVAEDIEVEASPDVTFMLTVGKTWK